ncbi:hypothetical protein RB628_06890 [Streptomyces sp. ADMS]|uniref:hypothetical protein n=1 Tax=Streptomyces sp. ADMS TaxID=3071415 RepID=UPI00296E8705|nr:hypothetical protein [Streptomyces sp. ADMS]MDW4905079.1 hypothetical protein [Streptomyces sp. ADMS]
MSNEQPPRVRAGARRTGPTLAEFREYLVDFAEQATPAQDTEGRIMRVVGPHVRDFVLRICIGLADDYAADHAATSRAERQLDPFSRLNMRAVARTHRMATRGKGPTDLDRLLDVVADDFTLDDVRIIRGVAAALADAMPRIAHKAREEGMRPDEIAAESGYTSSRIAQFLREEKKRRSNDAQ